MRTGPTSSTGNQGPHGLMETGGQQPEPPTLVLNNSGGSGADDEFAGSGLLWLWPLPPAGGLRLLVQWLDFGLEETSTMLDGGQLRDAAASSQQFWPEEEARHA